jgi:hypothetical protein
MNGCFRLAALDLRTLNLHSFYGSPGFHWQKPSFSSLLFFVGACLTRIIYCEGCSVSLRPLFSVYCFRDQACSALSRMSSLPNSFTYGSVSSVHSVRDAFASCKYPRCFPLAIVWVTFTVQIIGRSTIPAQMCRHLTWVMIYPTMNLPYQRHWTPSTQLTLRVRKDILGTWVFQKRTLYHSKFPRPLFKRPV